jgi:hypothetical protein
LRSRATFVELLCGSLISPEGWVTRAISAITRGRHWTTYCNLLERGSLRTLRIPQALFELVASVLPAAILNLAIDDTLVPRQSENASGIPCDTNTPGRPFAHSSCRLNAGLHWG